MLIFEHQIRVIFNCHLLIDNDSDAKQTILISHFLKLSQVLKREPAPPFLICLLDVNLIQKYLNHLKEKFDSEY